MLDFCKMHTSTKQGQMKIGFLFSVLFIIAMVIGLLVVSQPYGVYASGEKVADPWVVSVDGEPIAVVDSEEAGKSVETGLRLHYIDGSVEDLQTVEMVNDITVTKYDFNETNSHPVVMNGGEAVEYIVTLNEQAKEPVVGFKTERTVTETEEIPFETVTVEDWSLEKGETKVDTEGKAGTKEITKEETLINGEVVESEVVATTTAVEPVDKVILEGMVEPEPEPEETTVDTDGDGTADATASGGSGGNAAAGGGLGTAYSMIGTPYVYGGMSTSGVDCSGLVNVCYGGARGRTTYAMIGSLQASGDWKTSMSELAVGDLVFPEAGHVGIYIGNGQMIHAPYPGQTVQIGSVYSFYGGGSY